MSKMNKLIGYHGTTPENAELILEQKYFKPSRRKNEWLGDGVYFFVHKSWAEKWVGIKYNSTEKSTVLQVTLEYLNEQLIDLDDPNQYDELSELVIHFCKIDKSVDDVDFSNKSPEEQICFACNILKRLDKKICIMMYTFSKENSKNYFPYPRNQKQVCVNNQSIIKSIKIMHRKE